MPVCFQLSRRSDPSTPLKLLDIDQELHDHFGVPAHPTRWFRDWYGIIGPRLALGTPIAEIRQHLLVQNPQLVPVLDYLDTRYIAEHWRT